MRMRHRHQNLPRSRASDNVRLLQDVAHVGNVARMKHKSRSQMRKERAPNPHRNSPLKPQQVVFPYSAENFTSESDGKHSQGKLTLWQLSAVDCQIESSSAVLSVCCVIRVRRAAKVTRSSCGFAAGRNTAKFAAHSTAGHGSSAAERHAVALKILIGGKPCYSEYLTAFLGR